jgi:hypothetical protein
VEYRRRSPKGAHMRLPSSDWPFAFLKAFCPRPESLRMAFRTAFLSAQLSGHCIRTYRLHNVKLNFQFWEESPLRIRWPSACFRPWRRLCTSFATASSRSTFAWIGGICVICTCTDSPIRLVRSYAFRRSRSTFRGGWGDQSE